MRRATGAALGVVLAALLWSASAEAHRLKLFATVEGGEVRGYGYFVGGVRPANAEVRAQDGAGRAIFEGPADARGGFDFPAPEVGPVTIRFDVGEGHVARIVIDGDRFAALDAPTPEAAAPDEAIDETRLARLVEAAVARQMRPVLEAQAQAEARLRFSDIVGGVGMIAGLAGVALWARSLRS